jgi:hypothetical protein
MILEKLPFLAQNIGKSSRHISVMPLNQLQRDGDQDWHTNWRVIDAFVRDWLAADYTRQPATERIRDFERSVAVTLPPSAREWCSFALASEQIASRFSFRDCLVIEHLKDHDAISLLLQGEADFYWAIETRFLDNDDPPVTGYYLDYDDPDERFAKHGPWAPTVSSFAFDYLLTYLQIPGGWFNTRRSSNNFNRNSLIADFGQPTSFGHLELFIADGVLAVLGTYPDNWHHDVVKVLVQRETPLDKLPTSVQQLLPDAHVLQGPLGADR